MTPFLLSFNVISKGISLQIESILWESTSGSGFIKKIKLNSSPSIKIPFELVGLI